MKYKREAFCFPSVGVRRFELPTPRPPDEYSKPSWATPRTGCKNTTLLLIWQTKIMIILTLYSFVKNTGAGGGSALNTAVNPDAEINTNNICQYGLFNFMQWHIIKLRGIFKGTKNYRNSQTGLFQWTDCTVLTVQCKIVMYTWKTYVICTKM